jgi:two-component system, NtrC family, sensor kinase
LEPLLRRIVLVLIGLPLIGVLVFLYFKTQAIDIRKQNEIVTLLRQLKEIDLRWNGEIARARNAPDTQDVHTEELSANARRVLQELRESTRGFGSSLLDQAVESVRGSFEEKDKLIVSYEGERTAVSSALGHISPLAEATRATLPTAPDARVRARIGLVADQIDALRSQSLQYLKNHDTAARDTLQNGTRELLDAALGLPQVQNLLRPIQTDLEAILRQGPVLQGIAHQIDILPLGPRVDTLAYTLEREFQRLADEKEQYRIYLVTYSGALLVFLGWVGLQLRNSYRKLAQVNVQLVSANENLEHRVDERTHELSTALKQLKESQLLLVQSEKMSSLGQMVACITHEINTPLAYVKSGIELVQTRLPELSTLIESLEHLLAMLSAGNTAEDELNAQFAHVSDLARQLREHETVTELSGTLNDGLHGIEQITEIIASLKNFSRIDRSKVSRFDLNEGLDSALVIARNLVKSKKLVKRYGDIPAVECSPSQINQVFLNLITNAAQAIPDITGTITITTRREGDKVRVDVADNGHGIPKDVLPKIFDPFFTTKDIGQGTGLGLSIAYRIIAEHGGKISVMSEPDKGTIFTVLLPTQSPATQGLAA